MPLLEVFISSTCYDLDGAGKLRVPLRKLCSILGYHAILSENGDILYHPIDHTHTSCLKAVENADFVVAIISGRFGGKPVPAAITYLESSRKFKPKDDKYKNCSISQLEVIYALELGIPVFPFVFQDVMDDHKLYGEDKKNKIHRKRARLFHSIEKQDTAPLIFEFIDLVRLRKTGNNAITTCTNFKDIKTHLVKQWSAYFKDFVSRQRQQQFQEREFAENGVAYDNLENAIKFLGVQMVSVRGSRDTERLGPLIRQANSLKIMFVSGGTFISTHHDDIRSCIVGGGKCSSNISRAK